MAKHIPITGTLQSGWILRLDLLTHMPLSNGMTNRAALTHMTKTIRLAGRMAGLAR